MYTSFINVSLLLFLCDTIWEHQRVGCVSTRGQDDTKHSVRAACGDKTPYKITKARSSQKMIYI